MQNLSRSHLSSRECRARFAALVFSILEAYRNTDWSYPLPLCRVWEPYSSCRPTGTWMTQAKAFFRPPEAFVPLSSADWSNGTTKPYNQFLLGCVMQLSAHHTWRVPHASGPEFSAFLKSNQEPGIRVGGQSRARCKSRAILLCQQAVAEYLPKTKERVWGGVSCVSLYVCIRWLLAISDQDEQETSFLELPVTGRQCLLSEFGLEAKAGLSDLKHPKIRMPELLAIGNCIEGAEFFSCLGSHKMFCSKAVKTRLAKKPVLDEITIPPDWGLIEDGYLQHVGPHWCCSHSLPYHIYVIADALEFLFVNSFAYGIVVFIVLKHERDDVVDFKEEVLPL